MVREDLEITKVSHSDGHYLVGEVLKLGLQDGVYQG